MKWSRVMYDGPPSPSNQPLRKALLRERRDFASCHRGFTLIELVVTLAILSLLSLVVFARSTRQLKRAEVATFIERYSIFERSGRTSARSRGTAIRLEISPRRGEMTRVGSGDSIRVPEVIRDMRVKTDRTWQKTTAEIVLARNGKSANYALQLGLPQGRTMFVGVVGATGQHVITEDEGVIDALFE